MAAESNPVETVPTIETSVDAEHQLTDAGQEKLPYQEEITAAIAKLLEENPSGLKAHFKQIVWEAFGVEKLSYEDFGIFLGTLFSTPGVTKIEGKTSFVWLEGNPVQEEVIEQPERKYKTQRGHVGPLTSEAVVAVGSFEEMLRGWRREASGKSGTRAPRHRRRVHYKRSADMGGTGLPDFSDLEES